MTLSMAAKGTKLTVYKIIGRELNRDEIRLRLASMGFVSGAECALVSEINGSLIAVIKDTRIALDKSLGNRIIVKQEESV